MLSSHSTKALVLAILAGPAICHAEAPTPDEILRWWNALPKYDPSFLELTIFEGVVPVEIQLTSRESAYLVEAGFFGRGRNEINHMLLVRPSAEEVCELPSAARRDAVPQDLNGDGISEVVVAAVSSGGGRTTESQSVVHIGPGCSLEILHQATADNNVGAWGTDSYRYYSKEFTWEFVDLDDDGILDLREVRTTREGRNGRAPRVTSGVYKYYFENNKFVRQWERQTPQRK